MSNQLNINKHTILFRADGNASIGLGHFTRTLALAEMLNEQFHCIFAIRKPTEYQIAQIEKICHSRIDLQEYDSHFNQFLELLKGDEIVVLDNYYFTTEYQRAIKTKGCKLVCIDDMHDKHYVADVVINHAEGVGPNFYSKESYTKLLLGFRYALIRKEFRRPVKEQKKKYSCLLMMGGADPFNLTEKYIQILRHSILEEPIAVVSNTKPKTSEVCWFHNLNALQISNLMDQSEFGIFPASTVAIEACSRQLPFICGYYIDNQKLLYEGLKQNGLALCIGNMNNISDDHLGQTIQNIGNMENRNSISCKQKMKLNHQIKKRFVNLFENL